MVDDETGEYIEDTREEVTEDTLLIAVREEISWAEEEAVKQDMQKALDYYDAQLPAPYEEAGTDQEFSDMVSPEVRNAIEATLAEIMPGFYGDTPVEFEPNGPDDENQASNESRVIQRVVMTGNNGYTLLNRAFKDALLCRDGFVKVMWDPRTRVRGQRLYNVPPPLVGQLIEGSLGNTELIGAESDGGGNFTADIIQKNSDGKPSLEWIPADQLLVNTDHDEVSLNEARFVCHRRTLSASDLVAVGVSKDVVDDLQDSQGSFLDVRDRRETHIHHDTGHKSTRNIVIAESYYRIDIDGDGIAELNRVVTAGGADGAQKLLWQEPFDEQPICHGVAFFAPRGWRGVSLEERLRDVQDYKSDLLRQILDAGWRNLFQKVGVLERMVNIQDLKTLRQTAVRLKDPSGVVPLPDVQIPHQIFGLLETLDKQRRESGGGAIDTAPQAQEIGADSAHGLERIMSAIEETEAMVAKNLAETLVVDMYTKLHRVMKRHWPGVIASRIEGTWIEQVPNQWRDRYEASVAAGLSTGTRLRQAGAVGQVIQQQNEAADRGLDSVLVALPQMHKARVDYARLMGVPFAEKYWVNPMSPEAEQASQQKQQEAQQQQQMQMQMAQQQHQMQMELLMAVEQVKAQSDARAAQMKAELDTYKADLSHIQKVVDQQLKLIELNANYDNEEIPDRLPGPRAVPGT